MQVRRVSDDEIEIAYDVLRAVAAWIERQGRRQRITDTSLETYRRWQEKVANYAVVEDGAVVGVFTVVHEPLDEWPMIGMDGAVLCLRALATHPDHRGRGVGRFAIRAAIELARAEPFLYLDCVSGFLPDYYASNGFEFVAQQLRSYPEEGELDITLMRYRIR